MACCLWEFSLCFLSGFVTSEGAWASTALSLLARVTKQKQTILACYCREQEVVDVYEKNAAAVVNIFDITLQVCAAPVLRQPAGLHSPETKLWLQHGRDS